MGGGANHSGVVAVSEDTGNPCLEVVMQHGAQWQQRPFEHDMALMLYSTKLAVAMSSLAPAILQLSPVRKTIFLCESTDPGGKGWLLSPYESYHEFDQLRVCRLSQRFSTAVLYRWENSREQRQMLLQESCTWTRGSKKH
jgi:predicted P-loop ATPase/GTPase